MEMNVIKDGKAEIEIEFDDVTLPELLRVYLNKDSNVSFVAWRRDHPTKKPVLLVRTKGKVAKKVVNSAVIAITKDLDKTLNNFKKLK